MSRTAAQQLRAEPHQVSRAASSGALRMRRPTSAELPPGGAEHSSAAPESAGSAAPLARYLRAWRQAGSPALNPALAVEGTVSALAWMQHVGTKAPPAPGCHSVTLDPRHLAAAWCCGIGWVLVAGASVRGPGTWPGRAGSTRRQIEAASSKNPAAGSLRACGRHTAARPAAQQCGQKRGAAAAAGKDTLVTADACAAQQGRRCSARARARTAARPGRRTSAPRARAAAAGCARARPGRPHGSPACHPPWRPAAGRWRPAREGQSWGAGTARGVRRSPRDPA